MLNSTIYISCNKMKKHTRKSSSFFVPDVTEPVEILLGGLERLVPIPNMHRLLRKIQEQWFRAVVSVDNLVGFTSKQLCAVRASLIVHHLIKKKKKKNNTEKMKR